MKSLTKDIFRKRAKAFLNKHAHRAIKSKRIINSLIQLPFIIEASSILAYSARDTEVDTTYLIKHFLSQRKDLYLPFVQEIKIGKVTKYKNLVSGVFDILTPNNYIGDGFTPEVIILPGLSFDIAGNRIGYGSGWYDRYLSQINKDRSIVIGLCFDDLVYKQLPSMAHDQKVNWVVTEKKIINCQLSS